MITYNIRGQQIIPTAENTIASDSVNFIEIKFQFDTSWDDLAKTAQFTQGGNTYNVALDDDVAVLPAEIGEGSVSISVFGVNGDTVATTIPKIEKIRKSGLQDGELPIPPTPEIYQQYLDQVKAAYHAPYVDQATGTWLVFDAGAGEYTDTEVNAEGPQGSRGNDGYETIKETTLTEDVSAVTIDLDEQGSGFELKDMIFELFCGANSSIPNGYAKLLGYRINDLAGETDYLSVLSGVNGYYSYGNLGTVHNIASVIQKRFQVVIGNVYSNWGSESFAAGLGSSGGLSITQNTAFNMILDKAITGIHKLYLFCNGYTLPAGTTIRLKGVRNEQNM